MTLRESAPEQGGGFFKNLRSVGVAAGHTLVRGLKDDVEAWRLQSQETPLPDEPISHKLGRLAGITAQPYEESRDERWDGPAGETKHAQLDDIVAEAMRHGGRIPDWVIMDPDDKAIAISALALLGFPAGPAKYGSKPHERGAAGLYGRKTGTNKHEQIWLPSEYSTNRSIREGKSIAALVVAAETFEHKHPNTIYRRGFNLIQRLAHHDPGEAEPTKNDDEAALLKTTNALLLGVYGVDNAGQSQERLTPGSVAPLLLAIAVELAGTQNTEPELAAALARRFKASWEENEVHRASYPPDLTYLYEKHILGAELQLRNMGRVEAVRVIRQQRNPKRYDFERLAAVMTERIRITEETPLLANAARAYVVDRADRLEKAERRLATKQKIQQEKAAEHAYHADETKMAAKLYHEATLANPEHIATTAQQAAETRNPAVVLRSIMALYEQMRIGVNGAGPAFLKQYGEHKDTMLNYVYARRQIIADGHVRPEEAVFINRLDVHDTTQRVPIPKIYAVQKALEESVFTEKIITSNTGSDLVDHMTRQSFHPAIYTSNTREVMAAVAACEGIGATAASINKAELDASQLERLRCLTLDRKQRALDRVDALQKAIERELNAQERRGLEYELTKLKQWKQDIKKAGPIRVLSAPQPVATPGQSLAIPRQHTPDSQQRSDTRRHD